LNFVISGLTIWIIQSPARYHPMHTRVPLVLPPNTYTSPAHVTTQYIHKSPSGTLCIGWYHERDSCMYWVVTWVGLVYALGGNMSRTTTQYIHESRSWYHPIHTRVPLMIPPNTYTSPAHDTTQYIHRYHERDSCLYWVVSWAGLVYVLGGIMSGTIHESRSCYHPIHTRVPLMLPPNTYTSPAHVTTQYIHESHSCYHPIHTRVLLMLPPNTYMGLVYVLGGIEWD
jgi:hypothetical protein